VSLCSHWFVSPFPDAKLKSKGKKRARSHEESEDEEEESESEEKSPPKKKLCKLNCCYLLHSGLFK
jgi:hypothetical protein